MNLPARVAGDPTAPAAVFGPCPNVHVKGWSYNVGSAGRIKKLTGKELPWYNIYENEPATWNKEEAKAIVTAWCLENESKQWVLLLLGQKVCNAFGIDKPKWLEWYGSMLWRPMIAVPHPSGLNRWWNDEMNAAQAATMLRAVAEGRLPKIGGEDG